MPLVEVRTRGELLVERLMTLRPLDPLADHVDGPDEFPALGGVVGEDEVEVELPGAGLAQQPAANFLSAIVPEARVEPGAPPAEGAVALDVTNQLGSGGGRGQRGQSEDARHGGRAGAEGTGPPGCR